MIKSRFLAAIIALFLAIPAHAGPLKAIAGGGGGGSPTGAAGGDLAGSYPNPTIGANKVTLAKMATQATNTALVNATSGTAVPTAQSVPSCSTSGSALKWTTDTGFGCNSSIVAASTTGNAATASALAANGTNCSAGNYPLGVDAAGNAEGCTAAGGTPAGSDTQIQYNDASAFGASPGFTYTKGTSLLGVPGPIVGTQAISATSTDGLLLTNTTPATVGAQKWSPRLHFTGQGWKTTATAASQTVDVIQELVPVQSTTTPTSYFAIRSQINGGGYNDLMRLYDSGTSAGSVVIGRNAAPSLTGNSDVYIGTSAGLQAASDTSTICIGLNACASISSGSGDQNTYIGASILGGANHSTNTFIGAGITATSSATANAIAIGANAVSPASNTVQLGDTSVTQLKVGNYMLLGKTKFTASGCSNSATHGTGLAGDYTSGTSGTCTVTITFNGATGYTAPTGFSCWANDLTTPADVIHQTASSTTTATLSGTTVTSDVINFGCVAY